MMTTPPAMAAGELQMIPVLSVLKNSVILKNIFLVSPSSPTSIDESRPDILDLESVLLIGRHPDCDIVLHHPCVSRFHLRIHLRCFQQKLYLVDLSSVHGTRISDRKIEPGIKSELREGESFRVGGSTRVYELRWMSIDRAYDLENSIVPSGFKSGRKRARIDGAISDSSRKIESETSVEMNRSSFKNDSLISDSNDKVDSETYIRFIPPKFLTEELISESPNNIELETSIKTEELISESPNNIELETSIKIESEISNEQNRTTSPSSSCEFTDAEINTWEEEEDDADCNTEKISNEIEQLSNSSCLPFPNTNFPKNEEHGLPSSPLAGEEQAACEENKSKSLEETADCSYSNKLLQKTEEKQEKEDKGDNNVSNSYQNSLTDDEQTGFSIIPQISLQIKEKEEEEEERIDEIDPERRPSSVIFADQTCFAVVSNNFLQKTEDREEDVDKIGSNNHHSTLTMDEQAYFSNFRKPLLPKSEEEEEENKIDIYKNSVTIDEETEFLIQPKILLQKTEEDKLDSKSHKNIDESSLSNDEQTHFCQFSMLNLQKTEEETEEYEKINHESYQTSVKDEKTELCVLPELKLPKTEDKIYSPRFENGVREDDEEEEMFSKPLLKKPEEEMLEMHYPGLELREVTNIREKKKSGRGEDKESTTSDATAMCFSRITDGSEVLNLVDSSNPIQQNPKSLQTEAQRPLWRLVVDTTTLSDENSRNSLRLLQGLRRTRLLIPSSVVRDLDRLSSTDTSYLSALRWIEGVAAEMPWWVYVEPLREYEEEEILEFTLRSKGNWSDRPVLLSNDSILKAKAAIHPEVVIDTAEQFHRSLVNPFSERFMWPGSTPRGRSWTYVDDVHLRSMYGEEGGPVGGMGQRVGLSQLIHSY